MFVGAGVEITASKDENGKSVLSERDTEINNIILPIGEESSDLFDRLDAGVMTESEYTSEKGEHSKTSSCLWFKKLPSVLLFQENVCLHKWC